MSTWSAEVSTWSASSEHMERRGEHMERRGEHMERHVGIARGRPHVARGWREWRQSSRDGGALLPRRRRLRTVRAAGSARGVIIVRTMCRCLPPHSGYK